MHMLGHTACGLQQSVLSREENFFGVLATGRRIWENSYKTIVYFLQPYDHVNCFLV